VHGPFGPGNPEDYKELRRRSAEIAAINARNLASLNNVHQRPPLTSNWHKLASERAARNDEMAAARREKERRAGNKPWWRGGRK
jgi:hypothetical protein